MWAPLDVNPTTSASTGCAVVCDSKTLATCLSIDVCMSTNISLSHLSKSACSLPPQEPSLAPPLSALASTLPLPSVFNFSAGVLLPIVSNDGDVMGTAVVGVVSTPGCNRTRVNLGSTESSTKARIFCSGKPEQKEWPRSSRLMLTVGATTHRRTELLSAALRAALCAASVAAACWWCLCRCVGVLVCVDSDNMMV